MVSVVAVTAGPVSDFGVFCAEVCPVSNFSAFCGEVGSGSNFGPGWSKVTSAAPFSCALRAGWRESLSRSCRYSTRRADVTSSQRKKRASFLFSSLSRMVISTPFMEEEKSAVSPVTSGMVSEFPASSSDRRSAICPVSSPSLIHEKINDLSSSFSSPPSVVISSHRSPSTVSGASDGSPVMGRLRSGTSPSFGTVSP